ncbi:MAG: tetratricopeptide repeat protein [Gemmatimonadaceae bacterium]
MEMHGMEWSGRGVSGVSEARRVAESVRDAGLGDAPDAAAHRYREALALLGDSELTPLHADVLRWYGTALRDTGRTSDAEPLFQRSLNIAQRLEYTAGAAHALNCLAGLSQRRGDIRRTAHMLADAAILADASSQTRLLTMIHSNLGILADVRGDTAAALAHYHAALWASEGAGDDQEISWVLVNFGVLLGKLGQTDEAERAFTRGLSIARARGDAVAEGLFEENSAELFMVRGELDDASACIGRALDIAERRHDNVRLAAALKLRGAHERMCGRTQDAAFTLRHGLTLAAVGEDALLGGEMLYQFGLALYADDNEAMAREVWGAALDAFERIAAADWVTRVRERLSFGPTGHYL